jgi:hypothetical protein
MPTSDLLIAFLNASAPAQLRLLLLLFLLIVLRLLWLRRP